MTDNNTTTPYKRGSWEDQAFRIGRWVSNYVVSDALAATPLESLWESVFNPMNDRSQPENMQRLASVCHYRGILTDEGANWTINKMVEKLAAKQHDYGPNNILRFGAAGIEIRSWDKIARIANLTERKSNGTVEPLADAYFDLWGYMVILRMLQLDVFESPLQADMVDSPCPYCGKL